LALARLSFEKLDFDMPLKEQAVPLNRVSPFKGILAVHRIQNAKC